MSTTTTLGSQINRFGFWSAIIAIATVIISFFIPLDAPGGYTAEHADRVAWLSANSGTFILGWINQIIAMLSLSGVFLWYGLANSNKEPVTRRYRGNGRSHFCCRLYHSQIYGSLDHTAAGTGDFKRGEWVPNWPTRY